MKVVCDFGLRELALDKREHFCQPESHVPKLRLAGVRHARFTSVGRGRR